ncbi:MAG: HAMP domain-containing histidine kinase [Anaerolineales bacterium]|nr:HAMP domain-containing histidine kinase [Anaerolineales bacterium]
MTIDACHDLETIRTEQAAFLRTIAHALRTPMQSLQGFAELLEPGLPPAQVEHYVGFIKRDATHLAAIVDDLCLRHELASGKLLLFPTAIDVGSLLAELARQFEAQMPDCVVSLEYDGELPSAFADPDRLLHLLGTLLRNAARCRPDLDGPLWLTIRAQYDQSDRQVVFIVEDDGPQVPPEYASALFEPLPQLPAALGRPRLGVGLGLYVAREVARHMGGDLRLAINPAPTDRPFGNTFVMRVPTFEGQVGHA